MENKNSLEYLNSRFEDVNTLNMGMVEVFIKNNECFSIIDNEESSKKEFDDAVDKISQNLDNIYSIVLDYSKTIMGMDVDEFSRAWLEKNITDDDSYIVAENESSIENPISVEIIERNSYIQPQYIETILTLQELVKSKASCDDRLNFYNYDLENLIGVAKMLMYHAEDLEDLISIARLKGESKR